VFYSLVVLGLGNLATINLAVPSKVFDASDNPPTGYGGQIFEFGNFLVAVITFVIVAFVIF
jgi:large-conductance mechanosensitive channel